MEQASYTGGRLSGPPNVNYSSGTTKVSSGTNTVSSPTGGRLSGPPSICISSGPSTLTNGSSLTSGSSGAT